MGSIVEYLTAVPAPNDPFTPDETRALAPYFTNTTRSVFALTNLPETVKGALFARYSRSAKSLRRLFLDEFLGEMPAAAALEERSEEHTSELQSRQYLVCRLLLEKKKKRRST